MRNSINYLIILPIILLVFSCSKEEDEIPLADPGVSSNDFDAGYVGIKIKGNSSMVDSIAYSNTTKGFSFALSPSLIASVQGENIGILSKPLLNGNTGDLIECCVYLNTQTEIAISYTNVHDFTLAPVPAGKICINGTY